jgi:threonine dehydrogenase-like Zn-dependent dehydrogenase
MRALVLDHHTLTLADLPRPRPTGECLVRVTHAGICGTDLKMLDGYASFAGIPGHEFVGIVEDAPANQRHWVGRRVVGEINVGCGACRWCSQGVKEHCPNRTVLGIRQRNGAFADYLTLPAANLHEVPASLSNIGAIFVEPLASCCRVLEQTAIDRGTRVAVIGDGRLGNLIAQVMCTRTTHVVLFGRHAHKLRAARLSGIDARLNDTPDDGPYDVVVDATGRPQGLVRALDLVRPRGTIVLKSTIAHDTALPLSQIPVNEVTIIGSRCGPFAPALDLLARGIVRVERLVSATLPLEQHAEAMTRARTELKVIFDLTAEG